MEINDYPFISGARRHDALHESYEGHQMLLSECAMVGWSRFDRASAHLGGHTHSDSYEICYIVRGSVEWWAGSQIFQVGPRDIYITRPGETHGGVDAFMHPCELFWVQVRPRNALVKELKNLTHRRFPGGPVLATHFERLLAEHRYATDENNGKHQSEGHQGEQNRANALIAARAALRLLLVDTLRFHKTALQQANSLTSPSAPIHTAMQWIHAHFDDPDCLQQAAREAGLRSTQFRKRFQAETGFAPHDYLVRAQVQSAKRHLAETADPVTEIAFASGFSSSQYFATVFRKLVGLTPQTYRRHHAVANQTLTKE